MNRKIDLGTLNAKSMDYEVLLKEAMWLEELDLKGRSIESIKTDTRRFLEINEEDSVIGTAQDKVKNYNLLKNSLVKINSLTNDLKSSNFISQQEEVFLASIEKRLAEKIQQIYNIQDEDLYEEE